MARTVNVGSEAVSNGVFEPAPAGTKVRAAVFEVEETTVKTQTSENFGKDQLVVTVKILDDFIFQGSDGKPQNLRGREVRYNNVPLYAGKSGWQLAAFGEAVGWPVDADGNVVIPDEGQVASATQGREIVVQLGIRTQQSNGKQFNTVSRWLPANSKTSASGATAATGGDSGGGNPWA